MEASPAQKMKFSTTDFFSKCDQIRRNVRTSSHLLKKSVMENFILCAVPYKISDQKTGCLSTAWKVSNYGVILGPYFLIFVLNTGKYGPEKTPYLDTFHAVYYTVHLGQKKS